MNANDIKTQVDTTRREVELCLKAEAEIRAQLERAQRRTTRARRAMWRAERELDEVTA